MLTLIQINGYKLQMLMDPSIGKIYTETFSTEMPIELRSLDASDQIGVIENLTIRIFIKGPAEEPKEVKVELSSEVDLFFHYVHRRDVDNFRDIQEKNKLLIRLSEYPSLLENLINRVKSSPAEFLAVFYMDTEGYARLDIVQHTSYRFLEIVACEFRVSPNDVIRKSLIYRYNIQRNLYNDVENQIKRLEEILKHRASGLLSSIKKKVKNPAK